MDQADSRQYAFKVDVEERAAFNRAVEANGVSAVAEIRRLVADFLCDQTRHNEIVKSVSRKREHEFPVKEVRINAHFDDPTLRRFTVTCQYANLNVGHVLREIVVSYAREHEHESVPS